MASVAQIQANRLNAQKSTGPRTPEGKAAASQNAVRHGLLAEQVVIKGEDPADFERYREQMLEELAPVGAIEMMLADRAAGLAWRLRRAERLQSAVFATVYRENADDIVLWPRHGLPIKPRPDEDEVILGQVVMTDFARAQILDRLLIHERRIENSLYRTMAELRREQQRAGEKPVHRGMGLEPMNHRQAADATSHSPSQACTEAGPEGASRSEGGPPADQESAAPAELASFDEEAEGVSSGESQVSGDGSDFTVQTSRLKLDKITPYGPRLSPPARGQAWPCEGRAEGRLTTNAPGATEQGQDALATNHGQDAHATSHGRDARATGTPDGVAANDEGRATQSPAETVHTSNSAEGRSCETNPNSGGVSRLAAPSGCSPDGGGTEHSPVGW